MSIVLYATGRLVIVVELRLNTVSAAVLEPLYLSQAVEGGLFCLLILPLFIRFVLPLDLIVISVNFAVLADRFVFSCEADAGCPASVVLPAPWLTRRQNTLIVLNRAFVETMLRYQVMRSQASRTATGTV